MEIFYPFFVRKEPEEREKGGMKRRRVDEEAERQQQQPQRESDDDNDDGGGDNILVEGARRRKENNEADVEAADELLMNIEHLLPNELLHAIFLWLDHAAVGRVSLVCKRWCDIIRSSGEIWKKLLRDIDRTHPVPIKTEDVR